MHFLSIKFIEGGFWYIQLKRFVGVCVWLRERKIG